MIYVDLLLVCLLFPFLLFSFLPSSLLSKFVKATSFCFVVSYSLLFPFPFVCFFFLLISSYLPHPFPLNAALTFPTFPLPSLRLPCPLFYNPFILPLPISIPSQICPYI